MDRIEIDPDDIEKIEKQTIIGVCIDNLKEIESKIKENKKYMKAVKYERLNVISKEIRETKKEIKEAK